MCQSSHEIFSFRVDPVTKTIIENILLIRKMDLHLPLTSSEKNKIFSFLLFSRLNKFKFSRNDLIAAYFGILYVIILSMYHVKIEMQFI